MANLRAGAEPATSPHLLRRTVLKREGRASLSKFNLEGEVICVMCVFLVVFEFIVCFF